MQMVYQDPFQALNPRFTVRQAVAEPLVIHDIRDDREGRIVRALAAAGLSPADQYLDRRPHELSGGQRQRVAIAASLTLEPELLVADEPVSMLDVSVRAGVLEVFAGLRDRGMGILMITHDLATAAHFADRLLVMYLGRIVEDGPTRQVIERPSHPYTRALLAAVPEPDPRKSTLRAGAVPGETPDATAIPSGCRFHPRCPVAQAECPMLEPSLRAVSNTHSAALRPGSGVGRACAGPSRQPRRGSVKRLGVGIVGCGEAAQIMHLPALRLLGERFEVRVVCDASPDVAERVGERWGVSRRVTDWSQAIKDPSLDVVLVTAPHALHAPVTTAALEQGKHVLVEKPMCLTMREADAIAVAQERHRRVVQVGYMRRHAPAFAEARRMVETMGGVRLARIHDVLGHNELIAKQTSSVIRPGSTSSSTTAATRHQTLLQEAVGDTDPWLLETYEFLLTLNSHDLSAMRELFGMPLSVLYAARRDGRASPYITAAFDYGTFVCQLETGFDSLPRVDQHIKIFGDETVVEIRWGSGFVRHSPVTVAVTEAVVMGVRETTVQPDWSDPFVDEWRAFHAVVVDGRPGKTGVADARADLELARELVDAVGVK